MAFKSNTKGISKKVSGVNNTYADIFFLELVVVVGLLKISPILLIFYPFMLQLTVRDITCKTLIRQCSTPIYGVPLTMVLPEISISRFLMK